MLVLNTVINEVKLNYFTISSDLKIATHDYYEFPFIYKNYYKNVSNIRDYLNNMLAHIELGTQIYYSYLLEHMK